MAPVAKHLAMIYFFNIYIHFLSAGSGYSTEIQYFEPSATAMVHIDTRHLQSLSSSASSSPFMAAPGSPCDEQQCTLINRKSLLTHTLTLLQ